MYPVISDRKIRIAVVGCGRISKNHFDAIAGNSEFELVAVCDTDVAVAQQCATKLGVKAYDNIAALLGSENLDLVSLCTPSGLHASLAIAAARAGVGVVTEKPMATRWSDGLRMVQACDEAKVRLFVVKQNRLNGTLQLLKRALTEKRFGKVHLVNINVFWTRPQTYYDQAKWRGTWEFDGGAFMNQASHYIDLLDWMIGPVDAIHALMSTTRDIEVEDTGVMNVRWRSGALGSVNVTMLTYPSNLEGSITVLGERGSVRIGGVAVNDIQVWQFDEPRDYDATVKEANYQIQSVYGFGHPRYYENVVEAMRGRSNPETDGREGLKSLEILIAAYISARDGRMVSLPLEY